MSEKPATDVVAMVGAAMKRITHEEFDPEYITGTLESVMEDREWLYDAIAARDALLAEAVPWLRVAVIRLDAQPVAVTLREAHAAAIGRLVAVIAKIEADFTTEAANDD